MHSVRLDGDSSVEINRGDVEIALVGDQALTIDGRTQRSGISCDAPATVQQRADDREYRATINGGGPRLRIDANRSRVRLSSS